MTAALDVTNADEWSRAVAVEYARLNLTAEEDLAELARTMSAEMRSGAPTMDAGERAERLGTPYGKKHTRKRPGRTTIRFTRGHDAQGFYIDVGPGKGAFYLAFYEYGTSHQPPRPFLRPAIEKAVAGWGSAGTLA